MWECFTLARVESDPWWGTGFSDDINHILVGDSLPAVVSSSWERVGDVCSLKTTTHGRFLVLSVNPFEGVHVTGFVDGN